MSKRKPYVRPMEGWWKKNPYYVEYVVHESTALFVLAYALVLLVGLVRLSQGEIAWTGWLMAMKSPLSIVGHVVLLAAIVYHAYSWFKLFPLTMPPIMVEGKPLSSCVIVSTGWTAAIVVSLVFLGLIWRIAA